eukprot:CAMPEP_0179142106 /NCGR_PEP_ID=MMETSP0796-20121207/68222_1 /TAXON_ID=73915 /ORGANISM="Pyrodinium bahamense, Strain pbaha01" /LENGTH=44 /DNA_ID= /DNA_START= /DNA_END= /DNA_ORIENTATION=
MCFSSPSARAASQPQLLASRHTWVLPGRRGPRPLASRSSRRPIT